MGYRQWPNDTANIIITIEISEVLASRSNPGIAVAGMEAWKTWKIATANRRYRYRHLYPQLKCCPAHYYPRLKQIHKHLVGNYGNAWVEAKRGNLKSSTVPSSLHYQLHRSTTPECPLIKIGYTTGATGFGKLTITSPNVRRKAKRLLYHHWTCTTLPTTGSVEKRYDCGRIRPCQKVIAVADKVVEATKAVIRKFLRHGRMWRPNEKSPVITQSLQRLPADAVILTAGCAKYRYNALPLGDINGIPEYWMPDGVMTVIRSLSSLWKLREVFGLKDINDLPIVL